MAERAWDLLARLDVPTVAVARPALVALLERLVAYLVGLAFSDHPSPRRRDRG